MVSIIIFGRSSEFQNFIAHLISFLILNRLIPAMGSIATTSLQTRLTNLRCGLKPGLAGRFPSYFLLEEIYFLA